MLTNLVEKARSTTNTSYTVPQKETIPEAMKKLAAAQQLSPIIIFCRMKEGARVKIAN